MINFIPPPLHCQYNEVTLQRHPCLTKRLITSIQNTHGINAERLIKDYEEVQKRLRTTPIFVTHSINEHGKLIKGRYDFIAGFQALNLLRRIPIEERGQYEILIYCFRSLSEEQCIEFVISSLTAGLLSGKTTWNECLQLIEDKNTKRTTLYENTLQGFSS